MIQFTQEFITSVCDKMATAEFGTTELLKMMLDYNAEQDADFAKMYAKENKTLDNCWKYIMIELEKQAKEMAKGKASYQMGTNVFKLLEMAYHYYNEDSIDEELKAKETPKPIVSSTPVVPMKKIITSKPKVESKEPKYVQLSLFGD